MHLCYIGLCYLALCYIDLCYIGFCNLGLCLREQAVIKACQLPTDKNIFYKRAFIRTVFLAFINFLEEKKKKKYNFILLS
mgnify:FL=1